MRIGKIGCIANHELLMNVRSKWILGFSVTFALIALGISYFGLAFIGYEVEFQDFYRTVASLLNLIIYVIPIVALVLGANSFSGEGGEINILAAQPLTRVEILAGKAGGLFVTLLVSTLLGFGVAGLIIALRSGYAGIWKYIIFVFLSIGLATIFLSLSILITIVSRGRAKALVVSLLLWFFFVIFYDLCVIAISYAVEERYLRTVLYFSLLGNPIDIVRVLTLMTVGGTSALGPAGAGLIRQYGGMGAGIILSFGLIVLWIAVPLFAAGVVFSRQDL